MVKSRLERNTSEDAKGDILRRKIALVSREESDDIINCYKCNKLIGFTHQYEILNLCDDYDASIVLCCIVCHINCDDPNGDTALGKIGPRFETMTPNQRQIAQNKIYNEG